MSALGELTKSLGLGSDIGDTIQTVAGVTAVIYTGGAAAAAIGAGATSALSIALADTAISGATLVSAGYAIGTVSEMYLLGEAAKAIAGNQPDPVNQQLATGILLNTTSNVSGIPVIYGTRKVGGTRVFLEVSGSSNEYLHLVIALGEGEIDSIPTVYLDDVDVTDSKFSGLVTLGKYLGTDSQAADSTLTTSVPSKWTADHRGLGVAYLAVKLKYAASAFTNLPTVTAVVKGRKVYDPRTTTTAWSSNPALCIRDYLTNTRFGKGIPAAQIDDASFIAAANYCDELVAIPGGTQARYSCDGVVDINQTAYNNLKALLTSCRGLLVYSGGMYKLVVDQVTTPGFAFTEDNITGNWTITQPGRRSKYNRVTAGYYNPANNWQPDLAISDSTAYRATDNGLILETKLDLPFTANTYRAQQLAGLHLKQSRFGLTVTFTAFQEAIRCEVGGIVSITHSTPGWVAKAFRVVQLTLKDSGEVEVIAVEYDATVYNLDSLTAITSTPTLNLPNPFTVETPSGLTLTSGSSELQLNGDGTVTSRIKCVWQAALDVFSTACEIQYRVSGVVTWQTFASTDASQGVAWISPVNDGQSYEIRIRFINTFGTPSPWVFGTHVVVGKTEAPPPFDVFTVMAQPDGTRQFNFSYTSTNKPADWLGAEIRYTSGSIADPAWDSMTPLQDALTYYTVSPVEVNAPLPGPWTFAIRSVDTTGNLSSQLVRSITLPDRRLGNVFDEFFEHSEGFTGTKTNCHVQDGFLEANDSTTWETLPATWTDWSRWNVSPSSPISYVTPNRDLGLPVAGLINVTIDADGTAVLELSTSADGSTWSAWTNASVAFSARWIRLRITVSASAGAPVPTIRAFRWQVSAPIKSEYINDVVLSGLTGAYRIGVGDVRIPIAGSYTLIKRTSVVIQDSSAGTWTSTRIDQSLSPSPRWQFRLNGVLADPAFVDFFIEGY